MKNDKNRTKTRIAVYLIGIKNNAILLGKRINTNHMNEHWSLPAGHVYEGESCSEAMIREAKEECGINLTKNQLHLIGSILRRSEPFDYVEYIFKVDLTNHNPVNTEPKKCAALDFFDVTQLPLPIDDYILSMIKKAIEVQSPWIDEIGFK